MRKILTTIMIVCSMLTFTSCSTSSSVNTSNLQTSILHSETTIQTINTASAKDMIKEKKDLIILDVRTPEEFSEGHLENALNFDVNATTFSTEIGKLDKAKEYLVYCRSGRRSLAATEIMKEAGFKKVFNMDGGYSAWISN